jgi:hypothetical protein
MNRNTGACVWYISRTSGHKISSLEVRYHPARAAECLRARSLFEPPDVHLPSRMSAYPRPLDALVLLFALVTVSCTAPARGAAGSEAQGRERVQGVVRVVGSAPINVRVVIQDDAVSATLGGPLLDELRRLAGAEVEAHGRSEGGVLVVEEYRIVAIDGRPVILGVVEGRVGEYVQLRTPDGGLVYVVGAPDRFRSGEKVWVQGPTAVIAQTYGSLDP